MAPMPELPCLRFISALLRTYCGRTSSVNIKPAAMQVMVTQAAGVMGVVHAL
jgi:hypothetical protein